MNRLAPIVRMYQNPWRQSVPDDVLQQILMAAAVRAEADLSKLIQNGDAQGRDSYACVLLDPTRPRWQVTPCQRLMAAILLGPDAPQYLPNALAKADARDRHGCCNGLLVVRANFCLGDGEFAWGDSADFVIDDEDNDALVRLAPAGGSGLSVRQDHDLAEGIVTRVMGAVHTTRTAWLEAKRAASPDGHAWFNGANVPGGQYEEIHRIPFASR